MKGVVISRWLRLTWGRSGHGEAGKFSGHHQQVLSAPRYEGALAADDKAIQLKPEYTEAIERQQQASSQLKQST